MSHKLFGGNLRQFAMVGVLILEMILFQALSGKVFENGFHPERFADGNVFSAQNLQNVIAANAYVLILAMGMVLVIIAGHIDLSVGSVAAVVGITVAVLTQNVGWPWWAGLLAGLGVGVLIGCWNGFWVATVGVPAFVVTLAGMLFFRGLNQFIGKSQSLPVPTELRTIGAGHMNFLPPLEVGNWSLNSPTILLAALAILAILGLRLRKRQQLVRSGAEVAPSWVFWVQLALICLLVGFLGWVFATGRPGTSFPIPGVIVIVLFLIYNFIARNTPLGRGVYAVGGNRTAAALSGISVKRVNFFVMFNSALLAAVAGIVFIGRSGATNPLDGTSWELDAIASVFIGGASVWGGIGTVGGTMVGALVMAFLNNGLQLVGAGSDWTQMIKGLVLLLAVAFDVVAKVQGRPSILGMIFRSNKPRPDATEPAEKSDPGPTAEQPEVS